MTVGRAFDLIARGLRQAADHAQRQPCELQLRRLAPVDVAALRGRLGMTRAEFAARFGGALRRCGGGSWATGNRKAPPWCC